MDNLLNKNADVRRVFLKGFVEGERFSPSGLFTVVFGSRLFPQATKANTHTRMCCCCC
jgi:hypothetical protein